MGKLKITIEGFGVFHQFELDADIALAFMGSETVGILVDEKNLKPAIAQTAEYMLRPVYEIGAQALARQRIQATKEAMLSEVNG